MPGLQKTCGFCAIDRQMSVATPLQSLTDPVADKGNTETRIVESPESPRFGCRTDNLTNPGYVIPSLVADHLAPQSITNKGNKAYNQQTCTSPLDKAVPASQNHQFSHEMLSAHDSNFNRDFYSTWHNGHRPKRIKVNDYFTTEDDSNMPPSPKSFTSKTVVMPASSGSSFALVGSGEALSHKNNKPIDLSSSVDIHTFIQLWIKMTQPINASTSALMNTMTEQSSVQSSVFTGLMSKLAAFSSTHISRYPKSIQTTSPSKKLNTITVGSYTCATGTDIVNWLLQNSDGRIGSRLDSCMLLIEARILQNFYSYNFIYTNAI